MALGKCSGQVRASVTSLAAGIWQRYPHLSNKQLIEAIRNSASQANAPDNLIGYGIPNFTAVVNYLERTPQENPFIVYPNPFTADTISIRPSDPVLITNCKLELMSSQGQVLYEDNITFSWLQRTYPANLSGMVAGTYFIRLWWEGKPYVFKVFKVNG